MRRTIIFILQSLMLLGVSCSNEPKQMVDVSMPKGTIFSVYDEETKDSIFLIATDTIHHNDSVISKTERLVCNVYDSLTDVIHKGENCRANNASAIAIAKANGETKRAAELTKQNDTYEANGVKAKVELQNHLADCKICKRINK